MTKDEIDRLYAAIAHGDEVHRAWLKEAMYAFLEGKPIPPPRDKKIDE